jgi:hypothetical protein
VDDVTLLDRAHRALAVVEGVLALVSIAESLDKITTTLRGIELGLDNE